MEMRLDRAPWRDNPLTAATFPTPLALGEPGMSALVVPPPPPEPDAPARKGGARYAIPALLVAGWGGLFAYCATYLREDLPFRPLVSAEASHRADEPPKRVTVLPELPPEAMPAVAQAPAEVPAVAAAMPAPAAIQAVAPKRPGLPVAEFVGTWGPTPAACLSPSRRRGYLPATISMEKARAGKTLCSFRDGHRAGGAWVMAAECSDRGRRWSSQVRLLVEGDRLTWTSSKGTSTYVRCGRRAG